MTWGYPILVSNNSTSRSDAQQNPFLLGWFPHFLTATVSSNAARKIPELGMRFIAGKIMELNNVFSIDCDKPVPDGIGLVFMAWFKYPWIALTFAKVVLSFWTAWCRNIPSPRPKPVGRYAIQGKCWRRRLARVTPGWRSIGRKRDIGRLWPYSLFLRFEVKKIGSQVTKCAWSPTPVTRKWCGPFVVACDPIRARSMIFEGSLAEKSFLSFAASFLKEVSQKSFVVELRSIIFEGSLAEKRRFRPSKLHFWRKSRRKASF